MTLIVPAALKKLVRPRRKIAGSAELATPALVKRLLPKIENEYVKKKRFHPPKTFAAIFEKGLETEEQPELRPLRERAHALLLTPTNAAIESAEIDTLAGAEVMLRRITSEHSLLPAVTLLRGAETTLRMVVRATFFALTAGGGGWTNASCLVSIDANDARSVGHSIDRFLPLRHAVCAASEEEYGKLVAIASELRASLGLDRRAYIAWAFPEEPWANEDLAASRKAPTVIGAQRASYAFLLAAADDIDVIREEVSRSPGILWMYAFDLVHALAPEQAIPLLAERLPEQLKKPKWGALMKTPPRQIAQAIACFRTPEAAAALAPYATNALLAPIVNGFFRDAPELAGDAARPLPETSDAPIGETPKLLLDRPWRGKKGKKKDDDPLILERIVDGEGFDPPPAPAPFVPHYPTRDMTEEEYAKWREDVQGDASTYVDFIYSLTKKSGAPGGFINEYVRVPPADRLWAWNTSRASVTAGPIHLVVEHGLDAIPGFYQRDWVKWLGTYGDDEYLRAAMCLVSPRIVPIIARVAQRRKKYRRVALAWLEQNATIAALGLIPDALGPAGEAKSDAEAVLLFLARTAHDVASVAERYGEEAKKRIDTLLARDPLSLGVGPPKPPPFLRLGELPSVTLIDGSALDEDALAALVEMLHVAPMDREYARIDAIKKLCTAESLERLARELIEQWVLGDAPGRHEWMLFSAAAFPSEEATRRIGSLARSWAFKDQAKALRACVALAAIGTDLALLHLAHVADKTRFDALRKETRALLEQTADARDLTLDELADRTVPDAGLGPDGTMSLSFGKRGFTVRLDETLRPVVYDEATAPLRTLPRPNKDDDKEEAKKAKERFDALKKDLDAVADRELRRFERAMTSGRTWSATDFEERIVAHPLLIHLARRLVWIADGKTFRVAEDRTFADENDESFELPDAARVRLAHPAREGKALLPWSRVFTDYAIVQPFEQLGRATHVIAESEREALELTRVGGIKVPAKKVLGFLEARGFRRDNAGFVGGFLRDAGDHLTVRVPLSTAIEMQYLDSMTDPSINAPSLSNKTGEKVPFGQLDPVAFSELVRDLEALRSVGSS